MLWKMWVCLMLKLCNSKKDCSRQTVQHKKKISDQVSVCAHTGKTRKISIRRRVQLVGWFVNHQGFSQVDRSGWVVAVLAQRSKFVLYSSINGHPMERSKDEDQVKFNIALRLQRSYRLLETGRPGHPPQLSHSSCTQKKKKKNQHAPLPSTHLPWHIYIYTLHFRHTWQLVFDKKLVLPYAGRTSVYQKLVIVLCLGTGSTHKHTNTHIYMWTSIVIHNTACQRHLVVCFSYLSLSPTTEWPFHSEGINDLILCQILSASSTLSIMQRSLLRTSVISCCLQTHLHHEL